MKLTSFGHFSAPLLTVGAIFVFFAAAAGVADGHELHGPGGVPHYDRSVTPPEFDSTPMEWSTGGCDFVETSLLGIGSPCESGVLLPLPGGDELAIAIAEGFRSFGATIKVRWDDKYFYVESDGMPDHALMVGITAWQQQVPIPQNYFGGNAWRFPLHPVVASVPLSAKDHFFRGAIAIAVNGVPIFNPIKNDGRTDTFLAGELDEFGGHAGRADDYHYHIAPLHLLKKTGVGKPIAYALDGYPILGLTEPDGSAVGKLDQFNGHTDAKGAYHYHASLKYPYVNGGFHGVVTETGGQVDPQPRANGVRPATEPLHGAKITAYSRGKDGVTELTYVVGGETRRIRYGVQKDGSYKFEFIDSKNNSKVESYSRNARLLDGPRGDSGDKGPRRENDGGKRIPWIVQHAAEMDANKDGVLTKAEVEAEIASTFREYDENANGKLEAAEVSGRNVRSALGGFVRQHAAELDADGEGLITKDELTIVVMRMFGRADRDGDAKLSNDETKDANLTERPRREN